MLREGKAAGSKPAMTTTEPAGFLLDIQDF